MSDKRSIYTCHKAHFSRVKEMGKLNEPAKNYGKWAYWCADIKTRGSGWYSTPCQCKKPLRAKCPVCGREFSVKKNGKLQGHLAAPRTNVRCTGGDA